MSKFQECRDCDSQWCKPHRECAKGRNTRAAPPPAGDDGELIQELQTWAEALRMAFAAGDIGSGEPAFRMDQAAARIPALNAEVARLTENAKANNDLARMHKAQADEFRAKYVAIAGSSNHD